MLNRTLSYMMQIILTHIPIECWVVDHKINNDNGYAQRIAFSEHAQSIPTNMHLYRTIGILGMHRYLSMHVEYLRSNK